MPKGVKAPKGAFGGSGGADDGWLGDRGTSEQVKKFENGADYLFFQGPAPMTAVQPDLPSFFSPENFEGMEIKWQQIFVTLLGFGSLTAIAGLLYLGSN
jgi:hypothetical protein